MDLLESEWRHWEERWGWELLVPPTLAIPFWENLLAAGNGVATIGVPAARYSRSFNGSQDRICTLSLKGSNETCQCWEYLGR